MRIWTLHPRYLDPQGLLALWREALLAQKVLLGETKGYRKHPQLERFRKQDDPVASIASYLIVVHQEAVRRGYRFDISKIVHRKTNQKIAETRGQLLFEWERLKLKLCKRHGMQDPSLGRTKLPDAHPIFKILPGGIRSWENNRIQGCYQPLNSGRRS